jgi:hypothetical protein
MAACSCLAVLDVDGDGTPEASYAWKLSNETISGTLAWKIAILDLLHCTGRRNGSIWSGHGPITVRRIIAQCTG